MSTAGSSSALIAEGLANFEMTFSGSLSMYNSTIFNSSSSSLLSLVDLAPTFLKIAGIDIPSQMQGVDQTEVFYGNKENKRNHIFVENRHNPKMPHLKTYINNNYKISIYREANYGELFDLESDPNEYKNLWDNANAQTLKKDLLFKFAQATLRDETSKMKRVSGA